MVTLKNQIRQHTAVLSYCLVTLTILFFGLIYNKDSLEQAFTGETITSVQQTFGSMPLAPEQEAFVRGIAQEMGINRTIIIRKMNQQALAQFGYHNAFAVNPMIYGFIPISSVSFMFISEGFFEDLTPAEQRFLIGHEAAHIKHAHLQYLPISIFLLFIVLCALAVFPVRRFNLLIERHIAHITLRFAAKGVIVYLVLLSSALACSGVTRAYRRSIEKEADYTSLHFLACHEGLFQLIDRWQKEFKFAEHNPYFGLIADHPSCGERKAYCLELQNQQNRKDLL